MAVDMDTRDCFAIGRSTSGGGGPCLVGLLAKFEAAGYKASLRWLHGGISAFGAEPGTEDLLVSTAQACDQQDNVVQPRFLPRQAFALHGPLDVRSPRQFANPFFNNIRQNMELGAGITDIVPLEVPELSDVQRSRLPRFMRDMLARTPEERARTLAEHFFELEKHEQQRLQGVMNQHSYDSLDPSKREHEMQPRVELSARAAYPNGTHRNVNFPLSITAALERGSDHRYNNFWTFEHSRVCLEHPVRAGDPGSNYINGSFVNPLRHFGHDRLCIATQAPLPSTMLSFWTMIWEQRVNVIVMLARRFEAGRVQCDVYWEDAQHGDIAVHLAQVTYLDGAAAPVDRDHAVFIRRDIDVSRPDSGSRRIVQLQYLTWPDHSVPATPFEILKLIDIVKSMQENTPPSERGPAAVHCSAGIGRSGAFIAADAALSLLQRARATLQSEPNTEPLDVALARRCWDDPVDTIYEAVSVLREQRMGMVQNTRQYVFSYNAVLHGLV